MTLSGFRRLALSALMVVSIATGAAVVSIVDAGLAPARAQVSAEFQGALEPYGSWQPHPQFGEVWVPYDLPSGWRPYTYGHWVYTEEWGWYWVSDDEEADWGWVTFHYGRWAHDRRLGWFWVPGDEWGPAWVDWRRGEEYVGWAPLPPDDVVYEYDADPAYWVFVQPQYLIAPRLRTYYLPPQRTVVVFRRTVIVNRAVRIEHRDRRGRIAVNPGIAPGIVAAAARRPVQTFRVQPRVVAGTQGVTGAVQVRPQDLSRGGRRERGQPRPGGPSPVQATLQPTQTVVQPLARVPQPEALRKDEHGRFGPTPPRAAQGATVAPPSPAKPPPPSPQQNGTPRQLNTTTPPSTPPPATTPQPPRSGPPATTTAPNTSAPVERQERREERRDERRGPGAGPGPGQGSGPGPRPEGPGGPPPTVVRPIPPQASPPPAPPPPPPPQPRQVQPPPPPAVAHPPPPPPPQQRQVQPPPPPQRQVQPPPQPQRQVQPPPQQHGGPPQKGPPPKPGEKPNEPK